MPASSLTNLLSLRGRGGGPRRGGRGGRMGGPGFQDKAVQDTDNDASISRMSAVKLEYLDDPFAQHMVSPPELHTRRLPIINRGTYIRTKALDRLVDAFLDGSSGEKQIVSLGAGTDTRAFKLFADTKRAKGLIYHELDFPIAVSAKLQKVTRNPVFQFLGEVNRNSGNKEVVDYWTTNPHNGGIYYCHSIDLRELNRSDPITTDPSSATHSTLPGLRTDIPTLLLSECCLCYLEVPATNRVISFFANLIPSLALALYEPTRPDDPFGQMMVQNFAARRIRMPTLETFRVPEDQVERLKGAGFTGARAETMHRLWMEWVGREERERLDELEGLDEVEEWDLLAGHYLVAWGWRGEGFEKWEGLKA